MDLRPPFLSRRFGCSCMAGARYEARLELRLFSNSWERDKILRMYKTHVVLKLMALAVHAQQGASKLLAINAVRVSLKWDVFVRN